MNVVMQGRTQMREVKLKRDDLLTKLKENREKHVAEYRVALAGYRAQAITAVHRTCDNLMAKLNQLQLGDAVPLPPITFDLELPENHERDYDQVITMVAMSVDDVLTLRSDEFACYVMDRWDWKDRFRITSTKYGFVG